MVGLVERDEQRRERNEKNGEGEVIFESTQNSFAYSDQACVALLGVKDVVVVITEDAVLVASKGLRRGGQGHCR